MKYKAICAIAPLMAAAVFFSGCAKEPEAPEVEERVVRETEELFTPPAAVTAPAKSPDTVLAVVNGKSITQGAVNEEIGKMFPNAADVPPAQLAQIQAQMGERILDTLIIKSLLTSEANRENIEITDEDIDETIAVMAKDLPEGVTVEQQIQRIGLTQDEFRALLREDLRINKLMEEKLDLKKAPSEEAIRAFYDENPELFQRPESVKASHILISTREGMDEEEARAQAEEIRARIIAGEAEFAAMAQEFSACPSKENEGSLGAFGRGQMVPEFEEAAFTQEIGEVGPVVATRFGMHIVMVTDKLPAGTVSLEEAHDKIAQQLEGEAGRKAVTAYIEELKGAADIEYPSK